MRAALRSAIGGRRRFPRRSHDCSHQDARRGRVGILGRDGRLGCRRVRRAAAVPPVARSVRGLCRRCPPGLSGQDRPREFITLFDLMLDPRAPRYGAMARPISGPSSSMNGPGFCRTMCACMIPSTKLIAPSAASGEMPDASHSMRSKTSKRNASIRRSRCASTTCPPASVSTIHTRASSGSRSK